MLAFKVSIYKLWTGNNLLRITSSSSWCYILKSPFHISDLLPALKDNKMKKQWRRFRRLLPGISQRRSGFAPVSVYVRFEEEEIALSHVLLRVLRLYVPCPITYHCGSPYSYIIWGIDQLVTAVLRYSLTTTTLTTVQWRFSQTLTWTLFAVFLGTLVSYTGWFRLRSPRGDWKYCLKLFVVFLSLSRQME
jgi:hypothetical protein